MTSTPAARTQPELPPYKYFASTVALITSYSPQHGANVMACEWTMCVSWEPILVMSLIAQSDYTHEIILASREFGVNMCSDQQATLANLAGRSSGRDTNKFALPEFAEARYPATQIQAPLISGCVLNAECVIDEMRPMGEYTAFIGRALTVQVNPEALPLIYHRRTYFRIGRLIPKPKATPPSVAEA